MGWMTVGSVSIKHLRSEAEIDWIDANGADHAQDFIEIMDGDASRQYSVDVADIRTLDQVVASVKAGDIYRITVPSDYAAAVNALAPLASEQAPGYWSGEVDFSFN